MNVTPTKSDAEYEQIFAQGELYALKSLIVEWEEYNTIAGKVKAVPVAYIERVAKSIMRKNRILENREIKQ